MGARFAILLSGHASNYVRSAYGGIASLFKKMLSDAGETWDTFSVVDGVFPTDDELEVYDGFIVTGSRRDAHSDEEWVLKLCELIQKVHRMRKKLLGICFGHQVICLALGGKTGRSANGWDIGLKKVVVAEESLAKMRRLKLPSSFNIIEFHQDEVWELPDGAEIIASSEKTRVEIFGVGDHVLGVQGHPEFTEDIVMDLLDACLQQGLIQENIIHQARASFQQGKADTVILKQLCRKTLFIRLVHPFSKEKHTVILKQLCRSFMKNSLCSSDDLDLHCEPSVVELQTRPCHMSSSHQCMDGTCGVHRTCL